MWISRTSSTNVGLRRCGPRRWKVLCHGRTLEQPPEAGQPWAPHATECQHECQDELLESLSRCVYVGEKSFEDVWSILK